MTGQEFYDSAWHHPGMAWALCTVAVAFIALTVKDRTTKAMLLFLAAGTELDAFLTGGLSPFDPSSLLARNLSIGFVIFGDARMFVRLEKWRGETTWTRAWLRAAAWSFVVPVAQAITLKALPQYFPQTRHIFLVYETLFVVLACALLATRYARTWKATSLLAFFLVQYALWVLSDVLILSGAAWAYWLRLVPNALYYGLFLIFAARQEQAS
jgi:hypothetical protein